MGGKVLNPVRSAISRLGEVFIAGVLALGLGACHFLSIFESHSSSGGRTLWRVAGVGIGPPAIDSTRAFFLTNQHQVLAIDLGSGVALWRGVTDTTVGLTQGNAGCVVVAIVVACGDNDIVAFDRQDGKFAWKFHPAVGKYPGYFPMTVNGGVVYAGSPSGTVYAIDASGNQLWATNVFSDTSHSVNIFGLSVDSDIVVAAFARVNDPAPLRGGALALSAQSGAVRWSVDFPQTGAGLPSAGGSTALWSNVALASSADGLIYALDRSSGATTWSLPSVGTGACPAGASITQDLRPLAIHGTTLVAESADGCWLSGYDLLNRVEVWRSYDGQGSTNNFPARIDGSVIYTMHINGHVTAHSSTGDVKWDAGSYLDPFVATPAIAKDRLILSGLTGLWAISK